MTAPQPATPGPVRTCVGCRSRAEVTELLRVAVQGGAIVPDPARRIPGRGAYLHPDPKCLDLAVRRKVLSRALRLATQLPCDGVVNHLTEHPVPGPAAVAAAQESTGTSRNSPTTKADPS